MNSFRICKNTKVNELLFTSIDIFLGRWNLFYDFIMWIVLSERVFIYVCVFVCDAVCVLLGKIQETIFRAVAIHNTKTRFACRLNL